MGERRRRLDSSRCRGQAPGMGRAARNGEGEWRSIFSLLAGSSRGVGLHNSLASAKVSIWRRFCPVGACVPCCAVPVSVPVARTACRRAPCALLLLRLHDSVSARPLLSSCRSPPSSVPSPQTRTQEIILCSRSGLKNRLVFLSRFVTIVTRPFNFLCRSLPQSRSVAACDSSCRSAPRARTMSALAPLSSCCMWRHV